MLNLNEVTLVGNLGSDPEKLGAEGARFRLATNRRGKDGTQYTEWHSIVAWGQNAAFALEYLRSGDHAYVSGRLGYREREGGGMYTDIVAFRVQAVGALNAEGQVATSAPATPTTPPANIPPELAALDLEPVADSGPPNDLPF